MAPDRPPSVDRLARSLADTGLPHPLLVDAARQAVADGDPADAVDRARDLAEATARHLLTGVVNATGVLLHTNLGRAPWGTTLDDARYRTLEFDLATGERGSRQDRAPALLARACGAEAAIVVFEEKYSAKYPKAVQCLTKDREAMLAFFDFPAEHWDHLRTANPIESVFATVRHRTVRTKGALSHKTARLMVFKLVMAASKTWRRLKGENRLPMVIAGVTFTDGVAVIPDANQRAA